MLNNTCQDPKKREFQLHCEKGNDIQLWSVAYNGGDRQNVKKRRNGLLETTKLKNREEYQWNNERIINIKHEIIDDIETKQLFRECRQNEYQRKYWIGTRKQKARKAIQKLEREGEIKGERELIKLRERGMDEHAWRDQEELRLGIGRRRTL